MPAAEPIVPAAAVMAAFAAISVDVCDGRKTGIGFDAGDRGHYEASLVNGSFDLCRGRICDWLLWAACESL